MLKNHFKLAWRTLMRDRLYSVVNTSGLALGIAVFLIATIYVRDELSFDSFHLKSDRIYRVTSSEEVNGALKFRSGSAYPAAEVMPSEIPEIETLVRFKHHDDYLGLPLFSVDDKKFLVEQLHWTDPAVFEVFSFEFIAGDPGTCLDDLRSLIITREMAEKLFGQVQVVGKTITMNFDRDNDTQDMMEPYLMTISAVVENLPGNSSLQFEALANIGFSSYESGGVKRNWYYAAFPTYVLMKNPIDQGSIETKLAQFVQKYFDPKIKDRLKLYFQPLADVRLEALPGDTETNTNKETLMVVSLVSVLVLLLASVNYMNLSTARQSKRSREVGLLKVIGAKRSQIGFQFLFESLVITYVAILLALLLTYLILPAFNVIIERNLALEFTDWSVWLVLMMLGLVLGVISGIYPAVVLSTFGPLNALRTSFSTKSGIGVRKALVIFQFTCTMVLLIAIGTIYVQMTYLQNLEMDIDRDRYVFLRSKEDVYSNFESYERFKTQLTAHADIQKVAGTWSIPFGVNAPVFFYPFQAEGTPQNEKVHMHLFRADHDFIETFDLKVIQGRNFSRDFATDPTSAFLLNEQAVKELGWEGDAIGKELEVFSGGGNAFKKGKVIGIVQDLNFQPLHKSIGPMVVSMTNNQRYRYIAIRLTSQQTGTAAIDYVRSVWSSFAPQWPAELFYLEDEWNQNYEQEERLAGIMELLTVIGIFIASLGLFALASFIMEQRQKEVGIRKVLGATVGIIVRLLSLDFMIPLLIAFAIAVPIGWYLSLNWLDQFAYRITPAWWLFLGVLGISVVLSLVTISYHSLKVAIINPAVILKNE